MTRRGRLVLGLGGVVYLAAWVFGSRRSIRSRPGSSSPSRSPSRWVRLSTRPPHVRRHGASRDVVEGDDVRVDLVVESTGTVPPPTLVAHERPGRLEERRVELVRVGGNRFAGGYELRAVPRGRYAFQTIRLTIEDPFALAHADLVQGEQQALVVYPRLVPLERLFSEGGAHAQDGRRLLLRRPGGFELHSVRDHIEGESLRKVHWPSTARRGVLMVKELEDAPRDEVAVLLDGDATAGTADRSTSQCAPPGRSSGRMCAAAGAARSSSTRPRATCRRSRPRATGTGPSSCSRRRSATPRPRLRAPPGGRRRRRPFLELVVVTSRVDAPLADRLVQRALSRRGTSLVYVEAEPGPAPQLLRLQSVGIPVAVVRPGEDLAAALVRPGGACCLGRSRSRS